jgi:molecular chaperone IbpA
MLYASPYIDKFFVESIQKELESLGNSTYPPCNIYSTNESTFIELALAGFKQDEISIVLEKNTLIVKGSKEKVDQPDVVWRQRHISNKNFTRKFPLAEWAVVKDASFVNGLLTIELQVEIPEDKKPKQIAINSTKLLTDM